MTKTHDLYLEEAPEEFEVRAYDGQGNEFRYSQIILFWRELGQFIAGQFIAGQFISIPGSKPIFHLHLVHKMAM